MSIWGQTSQLSAKAPATSSRQELNQGRRHGAHSDFNLIDSNIWPVVRVIRVGDWKKKWERKLFTIRLNHFSSTKAYCRYSNIVKSLNVLFKNVCPRRADSPTGTRSCQQMPFYPHQLLPKFNNPSSKINPTSLPKPTFLQTMHSRAVHWSIGRTLEFSALMARSAHLPSLCHYLSVREH